MCSLLWFIDAEVSITRFQYLVNAYRLIIQFGSPDIQNSACGNYVTSTDWIAQFLSVSCCADFLSQRENYGSISNEGDDYEVHLREGTTGFAHLCNFESCSANPLWSTPAFLPRQSHSFRFTWVFSSDDFRGRCVFFVFLRKCIFHARLMLVRWPLLDRLKQSIWWTINLTHYIPRTNWPMCCNDLSKNLWKRAHSSLGVVLDIISFHLFVLSDTECCSVRCRAWDHRTEKVTHTQVHCFCAKNISVVALSGNELRRIRLSRSTAPVDITIRIHTGSFRSSHRMVVQRCSENPCCFPRIRNLHTAVCSCCEPCNVNSVALLVDNLIRQPFNCRA